MSMVTYYNTAAMYRHQQAVQAPSASQFTGTPMHSWYPGGYHHQGVQGTAAPSYCMQDEQHMWHSHHSTATHPAHSVFHQDFPEYMQHTVQTMQHHPQLEEPQLPSPPITVSGSELSSPGANSGNISPSNAAQNRPPPARSPYEWMKKASYQSQPNPGKTRTKDKYRVVYTDHQRVELEKEFYYSRYITIRRKAELASNLGLSERQVKIWFQNRRAKERKQVKKRGEFSQKDIHIQSAQQTQQQPQPLLLPIQNQQLPHPVQLM